ncbi:MAG: hypothetical protein A2Y40_07340 [Candidatus Margulisbacteria bacterium GWF2_35_9]|nr:MAG: hypothetical protein A2Y40_07340 [Candidatus Margulisbacteria bacterium GWF2_35_9]
MMGAGKSSVGKSLLEVFPSYKFVDIDSQIELDSNMPISEIFKKMGESEFRIMETKMCLSVSKTTNQIVSTGGGIILNPENVKCMKSSGIIFWLYADNETLMSRIKDELHRPLINTSKNSEEVLETITSIMDKRFNLYRDAADMIVNTSQLSVEECRNVIINEYERLKQCLN